MPTLAVNKKATFDYELLEKYEAGLKLTGQEVKSAKNGHVNLKGSYVVINDDGQANVLNMHIARYNKAGRLPDYDPDRSRLLLLKKKELHYLLGKKQEKGLTLVPTKVYTKFGKIKLEFAIGRGKKKFDKRQSIKKRELDRKLKREYGV